MPSANSVADRGPGVFPTALLWAIANDMRALEDNRMRSRAERLETYKRLRARLEAGVAAYEGDPLPEDHLAHNLDALDTSDGRGHYALGADREEESDAT